jgi:hypothetical protein
MEQEFKSAMEIGVELICAIYDLESEKVLQMNMKQFESLSDAAKIYLSRINYSDVCKNEKLMEVFKKYDL